MADRKSHNRGESNSRTIAKGFQLLADEKPNILIFLLFLLEVFFISQTCYNASKSL